jgi:hypothetical protein
VVPYGLFTNEVKQASGTAGTAEDFYEFLRDAFDMFYAEGAQTPRMMSVSMYVCILGHPARAAVLASALDHISRHDKVWVTRRIDIARHWPAPLPPRG